jgi:hypothetical protein
MIQKKEIEFSKELDDCLVLAIELFKDIKAGKSAASIAAENLAPLMEAISGVNEINGEFENRKVALQTIGYRSFELTDALLG